MIAEITVTLKLLTHLRTEGHMNERTTGQKGKNYIPVDILYEAIYPDQDKKNISCDVCVYQLNNVP